MIPEAKAAAIGAGLPIAEPVASMICDIGGGTTEVAVLSLGEVVAAQSVRVAGDAMDQAMVDYLRRHYSLRIAHRRGRTAAHRDRQRRIRLDDELSDEVRGVDAVSGLPRKATVTSEEVREALAVPLVQIVDAINADARRLQHGSGRRPGRQRPGAGRRRRTVARTRPVSQRADRHAHAVVCRAADRRGPGNLYMPGAFRPLARGNLQSSDEDV